MFWGSKTPTHGQLGLQIPGLWTRKLLSSILIMAQKFNRTAQAMLLFLLIIDYSLELMQLGNNFSAPHFLPGLFFWFKKFGEPWMNCQSYQLHQNICKFAIFSCMIASVRNKNFSPPMTPRNKRKEKQTRFLKLLSWC